MNRTREGWRTWYTQPMPNIGMFLCRGNAKTVRMFQLAWEGYQVPSCDGDIDIIVAAVGDADESYE